MKVFIQFTLAAIIVLTCLTFITGCSDKEKIAALERIIEEQKKAIEQEKVQAALAAAEKVESDKLEAIKAEKIKELKEKLASASVSGESFLFITLAEQLKELGGLDEENLREKIKHEMVIKTYINGLDKFLETLKSRNSKERESIDVKKGINSIQNTNNVLAIVYENFSKDYNQFGGISSQLHGVNIKSNLIDAWKLAIESIYSEDVKLYSYIIMRHTELTKDLLDGQCRAIASFTKLSLSIKKDPWTLWLNGGHHLVDNIIKIRNKTQFSDVDFQNIINALQNINSPEVTKLRDALLNYYRNVSIVYSEVNNPKSIRWNDFMSYTRKERDKIVQFSTDCEKELASFTCPSSKTDIELAQDLINTLPASHIGDLQARLEIIAKDKSAKEKIRAEAKAAKEKSDANTINSK
jgi:hypothetical protein